MSEERNIEMVKVIYDIMMEHVNDAPRVNIGEQKCLFCGFIGPEWALVDGWFTCPECGAN